MDQIVGLEQQDQRVYINLFFKAFEIYCPVVLYNG